MSRVILSVLSMVGWFASALSQVGLLWYPSCDDEQEAERPPFGN